MKTYTLTEAPRAMKQVQSDVAANKAVALTFRGKPELIVVEAGFFAATLNAATVGYAVAQAGSLLELAKAVAPFSDRRLLDEQAQITRLLAELAALTTAT